ncbi:MAG: ATP-dependent protease ATPase subunit HslU [Candidatus Cloacimonetes bacterium]|nr:ATP-dependent protease ATPase subunit HslU [Candidatus Cloacimonadota bacterium]MCF7814453.1 ATP-dependent protease ATPase subunit HslU [Candidatus Cloacimonadota bacterium]MCF7869028.1 ATP-dependent protease ATPase subunit HslU [Candidatus Cloacimonadota bacterium]MCF7884423.1 ATP-dependent protease ATPase subunit HslU [Candidatus Cloacimonadota bacterium]
MKHLTPARIIEELDKYIIGQDKAKKAVAIALRNRWRRQQVEGELQQEIMPNNIILIGPTGVGKTEIARRLSRLAHAPFIKVEASKFTEVGYVGRDVESMIRELMNIALNDVRSEMTAKVQAQAKAKARNRMIDILYPRPPIKPNETEEEIKNAEDRYQRIRKKMETLFDTGELDNREVEISVNPPKPSHIEIFSPTGMENIDFNIGEMMSNIFTGKKGHDKKKKMKVKDAYNILVEEESNRLVKKDKVREEAKNRVENNGIIFIDEIDKIAGNENRTGADVSRSGVQRDLLPIVEGSNVHTKFGIIDTSHILFIAAGAFSTAKPSDLIPELQGRFPIREELSSLTKDDLKKILIFPKSSLTKQYIALFASEKVKLKFDDEAVEEIAVFAAAANEKMEDIGARRLHTIMNSLLEDYLLAMPDVTYKTVNIKKKFVQEKLSRIIEDEDLSKYIL